VGQAIQVAQTVFEKLGPTVDNVVAMTTELLG